MQNSTTIKKIFDAVTIAKNTLSSSTPLDVSLSGGTGSLELVITGDGTVKVEARMSNSGSNFLVPNGKTEIATGLTKTSGPGGDGKILLPLILTVGQFARIDITETGNVDPVVANAWIAIQ